MEFKMKEIRKERRHKTQKEGLRFGRKLKGRKEKEVRK